MRPTARTIQYLKKQGVLAETVERWIVIPGAPGGGRRKDLFDCIDVIALDAGIVGIQCGAASGHSAHLKKCLNSESLKLWLRAGGKFAICSWGKRASKKKDGSKGRERWGLTTQGIFLDSKSALQPRPRLNILFLEECK